MSVFRSSGTRGFSAPVAGDPRRVEARKLEHVVRVRFTPSACTVQTPEGTVHAKPGDAILLGMDDEQWRASIEPFPEKIRPLPPTLAGEPGRYVSVRNRVMVLIFSRGSNDSPQVRREVEWAVHKNVPIIAFRIEDVLPERSLEYFLSAQHWLDAFPAPFAASVLQQFERQLARDLGPVAKVLVRRAAGRATSIEELRRLLSEEIESDQGRRQFIAASAHGLGESALGDPRLVE